MVPASLAGPHRGAAAGGGHRGQERLPGARRPAPGRGAAGASALRQPRGRGLGGRAQRGRHLGHLLRAAALGGVRPGPGWPGLAGRSERFLLLWLLFVGGAALVVWHGRVGCSGVAGVGAQEGRAGQGKEAQRGRHLGRPLRPAVCGRCELAELASGQSVHFLLLWVPCRGPACRCVPSHSRQACPRRCCCCPCRRCSATPSRAGRWTWTPMLSTRPDG